MSQMIIMTLLMTIPVILVSYIQEVLKADSRAFAVFEVLYSIGVLTDTFFRHFFIKFCP